GSDITRGPGRAVNVIAFQIPEMSNVMPGIIPADAVSRHAASFGKERVEEGGRPSFRFSPHTEITREDPLNPEFRFRISRDGKTNRCCCMRITRFPDAASKTRPQRARDRREITRAADQINTAQRFFAT